MRDTVLVLSVSGIGNTILQSPLIEALLADPRFETDVLFGSAEEAKVFGPRREIRRQFILPRSFRERLHLVRTLRRAHYAFSVACFPSNRIEFHALPFLVGARTRVAHSYESGRWRTLSFLSNHRIPARRGLHDVEQNLALLTALGVRSELARRKLTFALTAENRAAAECFLAERSLVGRRLAGVHAGCKSSQREKRWPVEHFVTVIDELNARSIACLLFAGPDELEYSESIHKRLSRSADTALVTNRALNDVGGLIERCSIFLSNDSGLGHVAAALGVPTFSIFGPAQSSRAAPYGAHGHVISLQLPCSPCLKYPFDSTHSRIRCSYNLRCLRDLSPEMVLAQLIGALE